MVLALVPRDLEKGWVGKIKKPSAKYRKALYYIHINISMESLPLKQ